MLSSTDENSFDLDGVGGVPLFRREFAEKTYRACQRHRFLSRHVLLATVTIA
jgi:hypothetical protein